MEAKMLPKLGASSNCEKKHLSLKLRTRNWAVMPQVWASLVAQMVKNLPTMRETQVWPLGWEDLLEKGLATYSSILAWKIHGERSLAGSSPLGLQRVGQYSVSTDYSYWLTLHWQSCFNVSETVVPGRWKYELCHSQELLKWSFWAWAFQWHLLLLFP